MKANEFHVDERIHKNNENSSENKFIPEQIETLKSEISKSHLVNERRPVIHVIFQNNSLARKYKKIIENFLTNLLEEGEEFSVDCQVNDEENIKEFLDDSCSSFCIDKLKNNSYNDSISQNVPFYSTAFDDILHSDNLMIETKKNEEEKIKDISCFNCLGSHHLKNCPEKHDYSRIKANKRNHQPINTSRYHEDEHNSRRKPGIISDELREALGLKRNQIPLYIYNMRILGYPPGWMQEAVYETSGLSLYDFEGKTIANENSLSFNEIKYDGTKFIDYPGFNSPVPDGFIDEHLSLHMPPLQPHQQLSLALKSSSTFNGNNMYKRKSFISHCNDDKKKSKTDFKDSPSCSNWKPKEQSTPKCNKSVNNSFLNSTPNSTKRQSSSLQVSLGTPILTNSNPFKKLPDQNKFAQGITDHIPFENLPNSVGTFEKMRGVLNSLHKRLNLLKEKS